MKAFLKRKNISISWKSYGIDAMSAMAQGLFASLLIGTIVKTLGEQAGNAAADITWLKQICDWLVEIGAFASSVAGPAMAISIAVALKAPPLVVFSAAAVGQAANSKGGAGGPLAVLLIAIIAVEFGKAVSKETKIDILVTPFVTVVIGGLLSIWTAPYIGKAASKVGDLTMWATEQQPLIMGIVVSVVIGMALTLPISSAAICAALGLVGLAGGAAVAGCCAQMVGFAVLSYKENKVGGLVSQGIGTSMLQMGNIAKKPIIWLPPIITSAITGPIATCIFKLRMDGPAISSGMGTCGFVGQIGVITGWNGSATSTDWIGLLLISFVLPAILCILLGRAFRAAGIIKDGDLKLEN
ncbi:MAG: PTS sugar transporter subunit IIC [Lachnospiraceae bacterium]|nr:PTS sugar transporter subunit IIC [Lachnospiraceae bacterium]